jgi:subtilisin family serine protease
MVRTLTVSLAVLALVASPAAAQRDEQWAVSPDTVLDLPRAWQLSQGAGVVVAVVDSGVRVDHPDLRPNLWVNPGERPGNGRDDDGNGFVDDIHGVNVSGRGRSTAIGDVGGHGTHVAGTIAAAANGRGVIGVAYRARVMVVRVLTESRQGTTKAMAEGIRYATDNGARIINLSLETLEDDRRVRAAVEAAEAAGVLIVCSAGNTGTNVDRRPLFPVAIPSPNLVGVGATAPADGFALSKFSNYGSLTVPVAAPGEGVLSTARDGGYETRSGTSMAAPHVAGVAALMAAANPRLSAAQLRALLLEHAVRLPEAGRPGAVEALASVEAARRTPADPLDQPPTARILAATHAESAAPRRRGEKAARGRAVGATPPRRATGARRAPRAGVLRVRYRVTGAAVRSVRLKLDGTTVAERSALGFPRPLVLAGRTGRRVTLEALGANGAVLATGAATVGKAPPTPPPELRLAGSAAAAEVLADHLRAMAPGTRVELVGGGTGMGIADAARGIVDAGLTSRSIFASDPHGLVFTEFARRDGCLVTNGAATQVPAEGVASAAPAEFLADFGTTKPRAFADSGAAAAFVRATPGAWGYVDPPDSEGLQVRGCRSFPLGVVTRGAPGGALAGLLRTIAAP